MNGELTTLACPVCGASTRFFAAALLLERHRISYFRCPECELIRTEQPYWLEEAYSVAINRSDVGLVTRNVTLSQVARLIISTFFDSAGVFLDYAGGYGMLVRLMRDAGFDFYRSDKYCPNLFADGFDARTPLQAGYQLLTAFEVFEHFVDPVAELELMVGLSRNILFSTELMPGSLPAPAAWGFYGLDHGQHISFYTLKTLQRLADRFGLNLYSNGSNIHLLTEKTLPPFLFWLTTRYRLAALFSIFQRRTLLPEDHAKLLNIMHSRGDSSGGQHG